MYLGHLFGAAVGYYGNQVVDLVGERPQIPLLLHFGGLDAGIQISDVEKISTAWPDVRIQVHEGAQHGFNCDVRPSYHHEAAADALATTMSFVREHLG